MLFTLALPRINEQATSAVVGAILAGEGQALVPGAKLLDLRIDLSAVASQDCPPISYYRIVLRDRAWLRQLMVAPGDEVAVGATLALFSSERDEPLDGIPARALRVTIAGVAPPSDWWSGDMR